MFKKKLTNEESQVIQEAILDNVEIVNSGKSLELKRGDSINIFGKDTEVVEVIEPGRWHVKNKVFPFDSFVIVEADINAPDLLVRPDNKYSL